MDTKLFIDSKYKKLWAYMWLLNIATSQQIDNMIYDIHTEDCFEEFEWALNHLEHNFGVWLR